MTIDEAIKRLATYLGFAFDDETARDEEALKLGIEALKRISNQRVTRIDLIDATLPGETEE